jgi:hypothetical protein
MRRARLLFFPLFLFLFAAACPDEAAPVCSGFVGDPDAAPEIELLVLGLGDEPMAMAAGARVPLIEAPQGGKHIFAGVRARNLDTCPVSLTGVLRDPASRQVRFEGRPVQFLDGGDGWAYPRERGQISSYANIPVCPNSWATKDIHEQEYELEVTARDRGGRMAMRALPVTPFCAEPEREAVCRCTCELGYVMGTPCAPSP